MACIVRTCRSRAKSKANGGENLSFHNFPKTEIRAQWFAAIGRNEKQYRKHWKLCSRHFRPECFIRGNLLRACLKESAVPTLNLPETMEVTGDSMLNTDRMPRATTSTGDSILNMSSSSNVHFPPLPRASTGTGDSRLNVTSNSNVSFQPMPLATTGTGDSMLNTDSMPRATTSTGDSILNMSSSSNVYFPPLPRASTGMGSLEESMGANQGVIIAVQQGRIHKLENEVKKLELIAKKRLLALNSLKQKTRRLKKKNSSVNIKLIELLEKEKNYKVKSI